MKHCNNDRTIFVSQDLRYIEFHTTILYLCLSWWHYFYFSYE